MTFHEYSERLAELATRKYPLVGCNMVYPALGVAGEAGELADKIKKHWRNMSASVHGSSATSMAGQSLTISERTEIVREMGDVLWYLWALAEEISVSLDYVAEINICKLADRSRRAAICGVGDNR